jgi:toxin HigB-1
MEWEIVDDELVEMYSNKRYGGRYPQAIAKAFRKCMQVIDSATDERDLYAMKSLRFEKLQGREPERSMRLNRQWRLIVELEESGPRKRVRVKGIEDYH